MMYTMWTKLPCEVTIATIFISSVYLLSAAAFGKQKSGAGQKGRSMYIGKEKHFPLPTTYYSGTLTSKSNHKRDFEVSANSAGPKKPFQVEVDKAMRSWQKTDQGILSVKHKERRKRRSMNNPFATSTKASASDIKPTHASLALTVTPSGKHILPQPTSSPPSTEIPVCKERSYSCRNRCEDGLKMARTDEEAYRCFCDYHCRYFEDCCADYSIYCTNTTTEELNTLEGTDFPKSWERVDPPPVLNRLSIPLWMITTCPESWPRGEVSRKCAEVPGQKKINRSNINATASQAVPVFNDNGLIYRNKYCALCHGINTTISYNYAFKCTAVLRVEPGYIMSSDDINDFRMKYCNWFYWFPSAAQPRRIATSSKRLCLPLTNIELKRNCTEFLPGIVKGDSMIYRNIHCALCSGENVVTCDIASPWYNRRPGDRPPMSLALVIYPLRLGVARPLGRAPETIARAPETPLGLSRHHKYLSYEYFSQIVISLKTASTEANETQEFRERTLGDILKSHLNKTQIYNLSFTRMESPAGVALQFFLRLKNIQDKHEKLAKLLHKLLTSMELFGNGTYEKSQEDLGCFVSDVYRGHKLVKTSLLSCKDDIGDCIGSSVALGHHQYHRYDNGLLYRNATGRLYSPFHYKIVNGTLLLCVKHKPPKKKLEEFDLSLSLSWLTLIGMTLSVVSLLYVLVTYFIFKELRTPPGLNIINLSAAILLSQLLWLTAGLAVQYPTMCTALAAILHYLFLVSFAWISLIAFDTWKVFSSSRTPRRISTGRLIRRVALTWLFPLLFTSICVALDQSGAVHIGYGSPIACWISKPTSKLYFFAIPVLLSVTWNVLFFALTVKAIKTSAKQTKNALQHTQRRNTVFVYVRIGSVMGFTWVFGFAASAWPYLLYPFVVFSSLQGLYIALAFGLNQRTRALYGNRFLKKNTGGPTALKMKAGKIEKPSTTMVTLIHLSAVADTDL